MKLPYPEEPYLLSYHNKAFPIGVVQANSDRNVLLWAALKSSNCVFRTKSLSNKFDVLFRDPWGTNEGLLIQQGISFTKENIDYFHVDLIEVIKQLIQRGCYVTGYYNEYYIPSKGAYETENFDHDFLLYGYDDKGFNSAGYVMDGRFRQFYITNEDLIQGMFNTQGIKISLNFFSVQHDHRILYNIDRFLIDLKAYLKHSTTVIDDQQTSDYYGIAAIRRLKQYFSEELSNGFIYIDRRYSKVLEEHKKLLSYVFECLSNIDNNYKSISDKAFSVYQKAKLVHRLGMKMTISKDATILKVIDDLLEQIIRDEIEYLEQGYDLVLKNKDNIDFN